MNFYLNGQSLQYNGDPEESLLHYLRNDRGIITPKDGCSGQGTCGACTVQIDDKAVLSCVTPMSKVEGKKIITTDGLEQTIQEIFAFAFTRKGGIQCGFCIPGIVMSARILLAKNPSPSREEIEKSLNRHLCRCTGYKKIVDSILYAAAILRGDEKMEDPEFSGKIGTSLPKYDSWNTVLGKRPYVADMKEEGMLFGALKFSDYPRAQIKSINIEKALQMAGVKKVLTAKDVPGDRVIGLIVQDWPIYIAEGEITHCYGDVLATVIATSEKEAREAIEKIEVDYEVLPALTEMEHAINSEIKVHPKGNILSSTKLKRGNVEETFKNAKYVAEGRFFSQRIEHAFLEPECALANCCDHDGEKRIKLYTQSQGAYEDRKQIAKILNLPLAQVQVIQVQNGGGFGGKEDMTVQSYACLASYKLNKPVQIKLSREESMRMHPKRHPMRLDYKLCCDEKGNLLALKADILGDTGAYASVGMKVLERAAGHAASAYNIPICDVRAVAVYTNNVPCGAMRGFGVNQSAFAMESLIDELCEKGGFDRWEFRYQNALTEGSILATGQILKKDAGVRQTLLAVKDVFKNARYAGLACGIKNTGIGNGMPDVGECLLEIVEGPKIKIHHGWTEMGQGVHTMAIQSLCEETGLSPHLMDVLVDTSMETVCGMTTSSRGTSLIGHSVIDACKKFKPDLEKVKGDLKQLIGRSYKGRWTCDFTTKPGTEAPGVEPVTHYSYSYASQVVILDDKGKVVKVVAAQDCGKIMNPILFEGQVEGGIHMGLGYALTEDFPMEDGYPKFLHLGKCGVLRARETPEMEIIGVEVPDLNGPFGLKGVGEIGLVPTAAATANALYQFDGVRRYKLPMQRKIKD